MFANFLNLLTYITSTFSIVINSGLIFLIVRHKPKKVANLFLAGWLAFFTLSIPLLGSLIIASHTPERSFFFCRLAASISGLLGLFYLFVEEFLETKDRKKFHKPVIFYALFIFVLSLAKRDLIVSSVQWNETAQCYLFVLNPLGITLLFPAILLCILGIYKLFKSYRKSRSAIEQNRLKYLLLGALFPSIGLSLTLIPFLRGYPFDLLGVTLSAIFLTYGILRYKLLDISIVIKKSLLYSILTLAITGTYLSLSLLLQFIFHGSQSLISSPTIISTAIIVALVFQPLQTSTQSLIDKMFLRRKYDPQKLVANISHVFSKSLDLNFLASELVNQVCETLQIKKAILFLVDEKINMLKILKVRNIGDESLDFTITLNSPFAQFIAKSKEPQLNETFRKKSVPFEHLDTLGLELFVPLKSQERLLGILILGPKLSEESYSLEELRLLETISNSATLALNNALFFSELKKEKEKVEEARVALEIKVGARTKELKELTENLDEQVKERTKELQQKVTELEKF